jgi:fucose 4-O-acetylase-like acetyltransferase
MQSMGKNSLMVYWVHVMIVYGGLARPIKRTMSIPMALLATVLVTVLMVALSAAWLRWKAARREKRAPAIAAA